MRARDAWAICLFILGTIPGKRWIIKQATKKLKALARNQVSPKSQSWVFSGSLIRIWYWPFQRVNLYFFYQDLIFVAIFVTLVCWKPKEKRFYTSQIGEPQESLSLLFRGRLTNFCDPAIQLSGFPKVVYLLLTKSFEEWILICHRPGLVSCYWSWVCYSFPAAHPKPHTSSWTRKPF